jgi:hypothetical protein
MLASNKLATSGGANLFRGLPITENGIFRERSYLKGCGHSWSESFRAS